MLIIENEVIYLTKGDDAIISVAISNDDNSIYEMKDGDMLTLTVKKTPSDSSTVQLTATSSSNNIVLTHEQTSKINTGRYSCDIQLTTADGYRYTIFPTLPLSKRSFISNYDNFVIMPEVTTT